MKAADYTFIISATPKWYDIDKDFKRHIFSARDSNVIYCNDTNSDKEALLQIYEQIYEHSFYCIRFCNIFP